MAGRLITESLNGKEKKSVEVLKAKQTEEINDCWSWVEPSVWTERMLNALESGVKGEKWFSLIDKVYRKENLRSAFQGVKRNKGVAGVDNISIMKFEKNLEHNLDKLHSQLKSGTYIPLPVKRCYIEKSGSKERRPLGIPTVRDRIAQKALCNVMEPIFEHEFAEDSFGFRPGRGCKDALREVWKELKSGKTYVIDADLKSYFDTIDHEIMMDKVEEHISDGRVLKLIRQFLNQEIIEEVKHWQPESGTPQGCVLSPLLANIYLNDLDHMMEKVPNLRMIRYADDFVIMCENAQSADDALSKIQDWCEDNKLTLHPEKTRIVDMNVARNYFDFLGYRFKRINGKRKFLKLVRPKGIKSFRDKVRQHTKRTNGFSMETIISLINPKIRGWYEYYKHAHYTELEVLDQWTRMRLRSILRKRTKRKGRGRGNDHHRYPNAYFHNLGLFALKENQDREIQSLRC